MAYSYPAVREFVIAVLREIAERPVDGVCLLFNRRMPLVEYEPPVVEGFQQEYGLDPRELPAGRRPLAGLPGAHADGLHARAARGHGRSETRGREAP